MPNRRTFLKIAGAAGALGLGGAAYVNWRLPDSYPPVEGFQVIDAHANAILLRLADLWLPGEGEAFPAHRSLDVLSFVDKRLAKMNAELIEQVKTGIKGFDYGAFVLGLNAKPFTQLDDAAAKDYVDGWLGGSIMQKQLAGSLRILLMYGYWSIDSTWGPTGYKGPLYKRASIPAYGNAPLPTV